MSLLSDLVDSLTRSDRPLADTLRSARILASRLESPDLATWVDNELSGYSTLESVPSYRKLQIVTYGDFNGPFGSRVTNSAIPYIVFPEPYREQATAYTETRGIAAIESTLKSEKGDINLEWDPNLTLFLRDHIQMSGEMVLVRLHSAAPRHSLVGVLDEVRNRLLKLLLDIEKINPDAGDRNQKGHPPSAERVQQIFHNHIYSSSGNVAIGSQDVQQHAVTVVEGDFNSLRTELQRIGVDDGEVEDLREAMDHDKGFGSRVADWLGRMVSKAYRGGLSITGDVTAKILSALIVSYLGVGPGDG